MDLRDVAGRATQVLAHSTLMGKCWHFVSFVFRMLVVATVGMAVYGNNDLSCITNLTACSEQCTNQFAPITPWTFWVVQLMFCSLPMVVFHSITSFAEGRHKKTESSGSDVGELPSAETTPKQLAYSETSLRQGESPGSRVSRRKEETSYYKEVYDGDKSAKIFRTTGVRFAYLACALLRTAVEVMFCIVMHKLYTYEDAGCNPNTTDKLPICWLNLPLKLPSKYLCRGPDVQDACSQHLAGKQGSFVPCYVTRFYEKSIFHTYMACVTYVCIALSAGDVIWYASRLLRQCASSTPQRATQEDIDHNFHALAPTRSQSRQLSRQVEMTYVQSVGSEAGGEGKIYRKKGGAPNFRVGRPNGGRPTGRGGPNGGGGGFSRSSSRQGGREHDSYHGSDGYE